MSRNTAKTKQQGRRKTQRRRNTGLASNAVLYGLLALVLIAIAGFGGYQLAQMNKVMNIHLNGVTTQVSKNASVQEALEQTGAEVPNGRLLAVDGSVLEEDGGEAAILRINGKPASATSLLSPGDSLFVDPGEDVTEGLTHATTPCVTLVAEDGSWGAIHEIINYDPDATYEDEVGEISGISTGSEPEGKYQVAELTKYSIPTKDKLVALTFDDGPWDESTAQVLDLLKKHDAKATFFVVGDRFDGIPEMEALIKREADEGHQVCTHSYSHAAGTGGGTNLGFMAPEDQIREVTQGMEVIERITGKSTGPIIRAPGGNFSADTAAILAPYVTYDIGWDIDTNDWRKPGAEAIVESLLMVEPGEIALLHDGGGDRSQTLEALEEALPKLKEDGWKFVTIDELLAAE